MNLDIRRAQVDDLQQLQQICIEAYSQNFAHHWKEGGLAWYIDQQFSHEKLMQAIESPDSDYYIIDQDSQPVGFCKLNYSSIVEPNIAWLEIEKIYLLPAQKGNRIGTSVLGFIVELAQKKAKKELILSVIDSNQAAIRFYEKNGFSFFKKKHLDLPYFKEELKGAWQMIKQL